MRQNAETRGPFMSEHVVSGRLALFVRYIMDLDDNFRN
jgi:hypothetical protein